MLQSNNSTPQVRAEEPEILPDWRREFARGTHSIEVKLIANLQDPNRLRSFQSEVFKDVENIELFLELQRLRRKDQSPEDRAVQAVSGKKSASKGSRLFATVLTRLQNMDAPEDELRVEQEALEIINNPKIKELLCSNLHEDAWVGLFPEAIRARTIRIVVSTLLETVRDLEVPEDPHLFAWIVVRILQPEHGEAYCPHFKGKSYPYMTSRHGEIDDFRSKIFRTFTHKIKPLVVGPRKRFRQNKTLLRRCVSGLSQFVGGYSNRRFLKSTTYTEQHARVWNIIKDPEVKQTLCPRLRNIPPYYFQEEIETEIIMIITNELLAEEIAGRFFLEPDTDLFAHITLQLVLSFDARSYCAPTTNGGEVYAPGSTPHAATSSNGTGGSV